MIKKVLYVVSIFYMVLLFSGILHASEYFTIEEFNQIHPEQIKIQKKFSEIVQKRGLGIQKKIHKRVVRIAFIYPGEQVSDYWRRSITSFRNRMDEISVQYVLTEYFSKPAVDIRIQEKQIKSALDQHPDYLVFTLDAKKHQRIIERIIALGRPRIILQNITTPLKVWEGKQPFLYVGFDHITGAKMLADYYIHQTGGSGEYAMLYFSMGYISTMRGDSFIRYIEKKSGLNLAVSYYTDGNREKSRHATLDLLRNHPSVKFIYACSTDVAFGAMDALGKEFLGNPVLINGWGGGGNELNAIEKSEMDVTVMRMNDDNGVAMAEAIRLDIEGKGSDVPVVYSGSFELIEKGIQPKELEIFKQRAFRYSEQVP